MRIRYRCLLALSVVLLAAACDSGGSAEPSSARTTAASPSTSDQPGTFPTAVFAGLGEEPVPDALAAELQGVLETAADGDGVTATLITPDGMWSGAAGLAAGDRAMRPDDQMSIASITKTFVAAQVMRLVEADELGLDDLAADRLPPDLEFDINGATIEHLLSMRSGISEYFPDDDELRELLLERPVARVDHRGEAGRRLTRTWPGRPGVGVHRHQLPAARSHPRAGHRPVGRRRAAQRGPWDGYERLIFQPDERPTDPMAMPRGAPADTFDDGGGYLPSIANATMFTSEGAMASDAPTLARWFRDLCAGQVVPQAVARRHDRLRRATWIRVGDHRQER